MANTVVLKRSSVQGKVPTTGDLALGELALNTNDGNLFFKRDVSGTESVVRVATNTNLLSYTRVTSNTTAVSRQAYIADTSGGAFTITLPSSPATGDWVTIVDGASFQTTALTVGRNSSTIADTAENLSLNIEGVSVTLVYDGSTWEVFTQVGANGGDQSGLVTGSSTTTFTNKTISGSSNTLSNIGNSSLTNSSISINGTSVSLGGSVSSLVTLTGAETLTNKTLTSPTFTTPVLGTPSSGTLTSCTGLPVSGITASTSTALGVGSIELGHATDTTIARSSAGVISVEGVVVPTVSSTSTLTNKTLTLPVIDNIKQGYSTTATAAGTTILTSSSNRVQFFTGTTTQVLSLPAPQTMTLGMEFLVVNNSTGSVEVRAANSATVATVLPGTAVSCISINLTAGNGAAGWNAEFVGFSSVTGTGANVLATSPTLVTPALGTPSSGTLTSCTGLPIATGISGLGTGVASALAIAVGSAGGFVTNGPVFRAYVDTGQTITSSGTQQKVTFGTETFDSNSNFASSRFTPTVAGYYQLNATVRISGGSSTGENMLVIWKNGSEYARGTNQSGTEQGVNFYSMQVSDIAVANGSTDYFEIYIQQTSGVSREITAGSNISYFSGCMIRGA